MFTFGVRAGEEACPQQNSTPSRTEATAQLHSHKKKTDKRPRCFDKLCVMTFLTCVYACERNAHISWSTLWLKAHTITHTRAECLLNKHAYYIAYYNLYVVHMRIATARGVFFDKSHFTRCRYGRHTNAQTLTHFGVSGLSSAPQIYRHTQTETHRYIYYFFILIIVSFLRARSGPHSIELINRRALVFTFDIELNFPNETNVCYIFIRFMCVLVFLSHIHNHNCNGHGKCGACP